MAKEELVALNVMIPQSQKQALDRIAADEYTSSAAVVRRALRVFLSGSATNVAHPERPNVPAAREG